MPLRPTDTTPFPQKPLIVSDDELRRRLLVGEGFNLREHLFYIKMRGFFSRTRQGSWTRAQVIRKIEQVQDEVKRELAATPVDVVEQIANLMEAK